MFYPRRPSPWDYLKIMLMLPDPDVVAKYGRLSGSLLREARKRAKQKGREHRAALVEAL